MKHPIQQFEFEAVGDQNHPMATKGMGLQRLRKIKVPVIRYSRMPSRESLKVDIDIENVLQDGTNTEEYDEIVAKREHYGLVATILTIPYRTHSDLPIQHSSNGEICWWKTWTAAKSRITARGQRFLDRQEAYYNESMHQTIVDETHSALHARDCRDDGGIDSSELNFGFLENEDELIDEALSARQLEAQQKWKEIQKHGFISKRACKHTELDLSDSDWHKNTAEQKYSSPDKTKKYPNVNLGQCTGTTRVDKKTIVRLISSAFEKHGSRPSGAACATAQPNQPCKFLHKSHTKLFK